MLRANAVDVIKVVM